MRIVGHCPMGCGQTLRAVPTRGDSGGRILCSGVSCPEPWAAEKILGDPETEHIVEVEPESWCVQHPLRERLNGGLFVCRLHGVLSACGGPPVAVGVYRAIADAGPATVPGWRLEPIERS